MAKITANLIADQNHLLIEWRVSIAVYRKTKLVASNNSFVYGVQSMVQQTHKTAQAR